jgi:L-ribulokinase
MGHKYSLGLDFGSLSCRAVLFDVENGANVASATIEYPHGIISESNPDSGEKLPPGSAIQMPEDYLFTLKESIKRVLTQTGISNTEIISAAIDFTSCSLIPLDNQFQPMSWNAKFRKSRHSYVKMWKQHTAEKEAIEISAKSGKEIERYGGRVLSEWAYPKILETLRQEPELYNDTYRFMEAGDWLLYLLTGNECMSYCSAGFKFMWEPETGYPNKAFFRNIDPRLEDVEEKLIPASNILPLNACAGRITKKGSELSGLAEGTPMAPTRIDGHSAAIAVNCSAPGNLLLIMGTSMGMLMNDTKKVTFPGLCGVCFGSIIPELYGYETGLSSCGDIFQWFVDKCLPSCYVEKAKEEGKSVLTYLSELVDEIRPGASGLLALDWWNGNRSILEDGNLSGMMLGLTLDTKPEEMLRSLYEAVGFAANVVIEAYEKNGISISKITAVGGIAEKNKIFLQIIADILGREIIVPHVQEACALGSAIYGTLAAGYFGGGYDSIQEAQTHMSCHEGDHYYPNKDNHKIYQELYKEYETLYYYFGMNNPVMKKLKFMQMEESSTNSR